MKQFIASVALQLFFGFVILVRELLLGLALLYITIMVLYHMFPAGWFRAMTRDLRHGRRAFNDAFITVFIKNVKQVHQKRMAK